MNEEKESYISFSDILKIIARRWWIIVLSAIIGAVAFFGYTYVFTDQYYTATVKLYVNSKDINIGSSQISISDITASRNLVDTYEVIAAVEDTIEEVIVEANLDTDKYDYETVQKMISVGAVNSTEIFYIQVKGTDPEDAAKISDAYLTVFPDTVKEIISGATASKVESTIVKPVSKGYKKNTLIGFVIGFVISAGIIFVLDLFVDDTIDNIDWVKNTLKENVPLLTVVPDTESEHKKHGYYHYYGHHSSPKMKDKE